MSRIHSRLDTASPDYEANRAAMQALVDDLNTRLEEIAQGGARQQRPPPGPWQAAAPGAHRPAAGPGFPFLELSALAGWQVYDEPVPAAGILTGIGRVSGACACWW